MSFFRNLLGIPEDVSEAKATIKAQAKEIKRLSKQVEDLREEAEEAEHKQSRWDRLNNRKVQEDAEDEVYAAKRSEFVVSRDAKARAEDAKFEAETKAEQSEVALKKAQRAELDKKDAEVVKLQSEKRELELKLKESQQDVDIAITEGILVYKEEHIEDLKNLEVKLATANGETKAAKAESAAKDEVIKAMTKLLEARGQDVTELIKTVTAIAPKINLEKLGFEITVPAQAKNGGDNKQKQN